MDYYQGILCYWELSEVAIQSNLKHRPRRNHNLIQQQSFFSHNRHWYAKRKIDMISTQT